ncbi:MAG: LamG domain-containing protein [Proteobacteria bacterium]|nr:LamG domain-containing protein [Pseudomonadota bacterium]
MLIRDLKSWFDERLRICISLSLLFSCQQEGANNAFSKSNRIQSAGGGTTSTTESPSPTPSTSASSTFSITSFSDRVFPVNALTQGNTLSLDWNNVTTGTPGSDTGMTYSCVYDRVVDSAVTAGTSCSSLTGTASFDAKTGTLSWTPDVTVWGSFELKVTGTSGSQSSIKYLAIAVRPNYVTSNLIGAWDAQFADSTQSVTGNYLSWKDLSGNGNHGSISNSSNASWSGSGTASSPYAINFNGSGNVDFGTTGSSSTKMMFSGWVNPSNSNSSSESVILGNSGNATGNGFTVRQKPSYRDVVMSLNPVGYWRLGESSGTTATDLGSSGSNGTYVNGTLLAQSGALAADSDTSSSFNGTTQYVQISGSSSLKQVATLTISAWVYPTATGSWNKALVFPYGSSSWAAPYFSYQLGADGGKPHVGFSVDGVYTHGSLSSSTSYILNTWTHVLGTFNNGIIKLYVNGVLDSTKDVTAFGTSILYSSRSDASIGCNADYFVAECWTGEIDEAAVFSTVMNAGQVASLYQAGTTGKKMDFVIGKSYQDVVLADSPKAYWRLGETSGTTAVDVSGNGLSGEHKNGVSIAQTGGIASDSNSSAYFDGTNDYTLMSDIALSGAFSISFWMKTFANGVPSSWNTLLRINDNNHSFYLNMGTGLYLESATGTKTFTGKGVSDALWHHIALIRNSSNVITVYVDGVADSNNPTKSGTFYFRGLGASTPAMEYFKGNIDEVALFINELSASQILAHYNAGIGGYGGSCTSTSGFSASTWNFISGLFEGSTASFYVNGRQECTVSSVPQKLSSASTNLTAGSTSSGSKGWLGYLSDLLFYGTSDGSSVATAANIKTNFDATADRYRQTPVGNIVTSGLVLNLDAANAKQGLRPFANGCASTDLSWFDLSSSGFIVTLANFATCGVTTGWNGSGVPGIHIASHLMELMTMLVFHIVHL